MKQIELIGPVDKRVVAYPLFKVCDLMGKVLVITDDANFRRFSDEYQNRFTLGRSDFIVLNDIKSTVIEDLDVRVNNYDYLIIISTNTLIEGNDLLIYCHGNSQLICSDDVLDNILEQEYQDVIISTSKPSAKKDDTEEKKSQFIGIDGKTMSYVWLCEENKNFQPCKIQSLSQINAFLFAQVLGLNSKEEFIKIIVREN